MIETERLDGASLDIAAEKRNELLRLFPEAAAEGGRVDIERLRLALGDSIETGKERYGLNWPGKADCFKTIQSPSMATLLPNREKSINFDTTENLIVEGDNLEVLKLLQKSYLGKIKLIYIDPPYNTGNDFIYPDDYSESLQTYLEYTGQVDVEGRRFGTNTDTDGRFHSKWLNMMYPRLYLARNLLRDDGVVVASIDDAEVNNLKFLMNDVFGEESFVAQIAVVNNLKGRNDRKHIATAHEYILIYANEQFESYGLPLSKEQLAEYRQVDDGGLAFQWRDLRKRGGADTRAARPNLYYPIFVNPLSGDVSLEQTDQFARPVFPMKSDGTEGCWRWGASTARKNLRDLRGFSVEKKGKWNINYRVYLEKNGEVRSTKPKSVWMGPEFSTDAATKSFRALLPQVQDPMTPKPLGLLLTLLRFAVDDGDIVLDFFAGTGTTGDAVINLNAEDGSHRAFILVQLPERVNHSEFQTVSDITVARLRSAIDKLNAAEMQTLDIGTASKQDRGFRVFRLAQSNVKEWDAEIQHDVAALEEQLSLGVDHLRQGRNDADILYEVILKSGYPLSVRIDVETVDDRRVYSISEGAFLICLERKLTLGLIRAIAERRPERALFLDEGFAGNDQLKANAVQAFKARDIVFRTV